MKTQQFLGGAMRAHFMQYIPLKLLKLLITVCRSDEIPTILTVYYPNEDWVV